MMNAGILLLQKNCPIRILSRAKNYFVSNYKTSNAIILTIWMLDLLHSFYVLFVLDKLTNR